MAFQVKDRIKQTVDAPTTTSPFDFDSNGATPTGYISFETGLADGDTCIYTAEDSSGNWEVGVGTWAETAKTLTRTTILSSSTGSAVTFSGKVTVYGSVDASTIRNSNLRTKAASVTTADVTGEIGTMHVLNISGISTADRSFALPATAAVGDRVGVMISAGDDTYELLLKPATGDTINGGTAGTEWSRLFITGEVVIFRCITADSAWIVEYDGRIPSHVRISDSFTHTSTSLEQYPDFASVAIAKEIGDILDEGNDRINFRRPYSLYNINSTISGSMTDTKYLAGYIYNKDGVITSESQTASTTAITVLNLSANYWATTDDYTQTSVKQNDGTTETINIDISVTEIL